MKILLLAGSYPPETGGIARFMEAFAEGLRRQKIDVEVLSKVSGAEHGYLRQVRAWREAAAQRCEKNSFDRIVTSSWSPFAVGLPLDAPGGAIPFDIFCHGMDLLEPARSLRYRFLMKRTLQKAARILTNSRYTADLAEGIGASREKIVVIPPGVAGQHFMPGKRTSSMPTILSVGRFVERKGFDIVLRSLPMVLHRHPDARYVCAGSGPFGKRLKELSVELQVEDHVQFINDPSDEELLQIYRDADLFVMPNRIVESERSVEGFGIVFIEAGACGLPVIGGNSGGVPDAIEDGVTGYLVDPIDTDCLSQRICQLLDDSVLRQTMGMAGKERAMRLFSEGQIAERYLSSIGATTIPGDRIGDSPNHRLR